MSRNPQPESGAISSAAFGVSEDGTAILAGCQICGLAMPLAFHTLHLVAQHWNWLQNLHVRPDLLKVARDKGV